MVERPCPNRHPNGALDVPGLLRKVHDGRRIPSADFDALKDDGYVHGTVALPTISAKGKRIISGRSRSSTSNKTKGAGGLTLAQRMVLPEAIDRMANPRKGEANLLDLADLAAAERFTRDVNMAGLRQRTTQN